MDWNSILTELWSLLDRGPARYTKTRDGVAIEFSDGCDALVVEKATVAKAQWTGSACQIAWQRCRASLEGMTVSKNHRRGER